MEYDGVGRSGSQALLALGQVAVDQAASYEALYDAHRARVLRLCHLLLRDPEEAEEVSQEVFLKLHRAYQAAGSAPNWGPWLSRVTVNACRDRRRSRWWKWWRRSDEYHDEAHAGVGLTPEEAVLGQELRQRIWQAFRDLPARQREVFALRHIEGWSTEAVAETLQVSSGTVKQHLFRAVHHMRRALGGRE